MAVESSLNSRKEKIYIEVLVHNINLSSHKIQDVRTSSLCVRAEFVELPSVKIRQEQFVSANEGKDESHPEKNCIDFSSGKSCLFVDLPSNISEKMNLKPLKIEIISKKESQYLSLCETKVFFSDCDCKETSLISKDNIHVPIISKNIYELMDQQGPSGTIELSLNLCSRKSSFVNGFQNLESGSKSLPEISENNLALIEAPKTPPTAKLGEPEFENLTSAEKLNDSNYRKSIYRTYPNEPTCGCEKEKSKKSTRESNCPGGCTNQCCFSSRKKSRKKTNANSSLGSKRLRGGGEGLGNLENNYKIENLDSSNMCDNVFKRRWRNGYNSGINMKYNNTSESRFRLGGGGEEESNCNNQNVDSNIPETMQKNNSCCRDKKILDSLMERRSDQQAIRKPCLGIDCLIKKFEETQRFVDSVGKVPGLAGLGLMDPSESPYFGRGKEDDEVVRKESKINTLPPPPTIHPKINHNSTGICSLKSHPGRLGMIREIIPLNPILSGSVIPGPKGKKKDEKMEKQKEAEPALVCLVESGPCGDLKCRSKRKKINVEVEGNSILKGSNKVKINEKNSKNKKRKNKFSFGAGGERNTSKASMKGNRRITKFIYSAGDTYPGYNCGHKTCVDHVPRVPANMGWLWHPEIPLGRLKPRTGWKPGAINSRLRQILREVKASFWHGGKPKSAPSRSKTGVNSTKRKRSFSSVRKETTKPQEITEQEWKEPPPTLHIHRKDGIYYVTMYPIKQDKMDIPKLEEPTKPLQFKIVKNRDENSDASSSTASDMEIEFSPPAAVNRYRKMPDIIHVETQVKQQEILDAFKVPAPKKTDRKYGKEKKAKK